MKVVGWLLALGLVAVMAVVVYPIFAKAKPITHPVTCHSKVKQQAIAILIYQTDYNDRFPLRDNWMDAIGPYAKNDFTLHCPALQESQPDNRIFGYCFNAKLSGAKQLATPDKVELIFDSINLARNASGFLDSLPRPGRHSGQNYIAYTDGHAKAVQSP